MSRAGAGGQEMVKLALDPNHQTFSEGGDVMANHTHRGRKKDDSDQLINRCDDPYAGTSQRIIGPSQ